jgi:drug/metabolite transporter (DMT)-like permease
VKKPRVGVQYMLWSVLFFGLAHSCVKFLPHLSFLQLVFLRQLIAMILCILPLWKLGILPTGKNKPLLIGRGVAGTIALTTYFYSLQHMPLATAVTIQYLSPILTLLLAHFILKERTAKTQWWLAIVAFAGVLMVKGFDARVSNFELAIALTSVVFSALAYNTVRALKGEDHELVIVFYFTAVSLPLIGPFAFSEWQAPGFYDWGFIFLIGFFTWAAQLAMTKAYKLEPASDVAIYSYVGLVLALALGYFFFEESFDWMTLLGMGLILGSVAMAARMKPRVVMARATPNALQSPND